MIHLVSPLVQLFITSASPLVHFHFNSCNNSQFNPCSNSFFISHFISNTVQLTSSSCKVHFKFCNVNGHFPFNAGSIPIQFLWTLCLSPLSIPVPPLNLTSPVHFSIPPTLPSPPNFHPTYVPPPPSLSLWETNTHTWQSYISRYLLDWVTPPVIYFTFHYYLHASDYTICHFGAPPKPWYLFDAGSDNIHQM